MIRFAPASRTSRISAASTSGSVEDAVPGGYAQVAFGLMATVWPGLTKRPMPPMPSSAVFRMSAAESVFRPLATATAGHASALADRAQAK